jgi:hypothetical protein
MMSIMSNPYDLSRPVQRMTGIETWPPHVGERGKKEDKGEQSRHSFARSMQGLDQALVQSHNSRTRIQTSE